MSNLVLQFHPKSCYQWLSVVMHNKGGAPPCSSLFAELLEVQRRSICCRFWGDVSYL